MHIKGTAFVAREQEMIKQVGKPRWDEFVKQVAQKEPYFKNRVVTTTLVPLKPFLMFQDELVKTFFKGDPKAYWRLGEASAEWTLTAGPYQLFLRNRDFNSFIHQVPSRLWESFYDGGQVEVVLSDNLVNLQILGLPFWHIHFEYVIMGYVKKALELFGLKNVEAHPLKGVSQGDQAIHYQFTFQR